MEEKTKAVIRKVIKLGPKSLAVTIPAEFAAENGIKPGDMVLVKYDGNIVLTKIPPELLK